MNTRVNLAKLKILFITHSRATGFPQKFCDWSIKRTADFISIDHPLHPSWGTKTIVTVYKKGKLIKLFSVPRIGNLFFVNYVLDVVISFIFGMLLIRDEVDIGLGANNLNTLALLLFKRLGKVKYVIYHTVDYTPYRFANLIINTIYHRIDRYCCKYSDMLWNSSGRMNGGRIKNRVPAREIAHTIVTPDGSNFDYRKRLPLSKIDRKLIVFLGHLRKGMGLSFLLHSFIFVLQKVPDAKLLIIGSGPLQKPLMEEVRILKINQYVTFTGFLPDHSDVDNYLKTGAIGVAPFVPTEQSIEYYSDVGKPKAYLSAGLPVVITRGPELADEIAVNQAGFCSSFDIKEFSQLIVKLLMDERMYEIYRANAIQLSKKYRWDGIFRSAFGKTLLYLNLLS